MDIVTFIIIFIIIAISIFVSIAITGDIKKPIATILICLIVSGGATSFFVGISDCRNRDFVENYIEKKETVELLEKHGFKMTSEDFLEILELNEKFVREKEQFEKEQIHFIKNPYIGIEIMDLPQISEGS